VKNAGEQEIRAHFATLFGCGENRVAVVRDGDGFKAKGCEHVMSYRCEGSECKPTRTAELPPPVAGDGTVQLRLSFELGNGVVLGLAVTPAAVKNT
jgi:hypothetical protein